MSQTKTAPWLCSCCGLQNSYWRSKCQACMTINSQPSLINNSNCIVINTTNRHLLVFGYLRQNQYYIHIPTDLSNICLKFYNDIINWNFKDDQLTKFHDCDQEQFIEEGPTFKVNNIEFKLRVAPKYFDEGADCVYFGFRTNHELLPENIENITISFIQYLEEVGYLYRHTTTLQRYARGSKWYWPAVKYDDIKHHKQLNFGCYVEILKIKYVDKTLKYYSDPQININYKWEWNLDRRELIKFKTFPYDRSLYSPNFNNDCFCIVLSPNGLSTLSESKGLILTKIKLLRLPQQIGGFHAYYSIELTSFKPINYYLNKQETKHFRYDRSDEDCTDKNVQSELFKIADVITITVTMKILHVEDEDGNKIERNKWNQYGFVE